MNILPKPDVQAETFVLVPGLVDKEGCQVLLDARLVEALLRAPI